MVQDEAILWSSLLLVVVGYSFHRMGPSFRRSRFGYPLALLGASCFVFLPEELSKPESELYNSIIGMITLVVPFLLGVFLVLRDSPTYGDSRPAGLFLGWAAIGTSWAILYFEQMSVSGSSIISGLLSSVGILLGFVMSYLGASIVERSIGLEFSSEPLTNEEGQLVRTILERRLGGGGHDN